MLEIAHLTDGGITILEDQPDFTGRKLDMGIFPFFRHQLTISSCAPDDLATLSHFQLDIMNQRASGNIAQGKGIAGFDIGRRASDHLIPRSKLGGGKDISLLPIGIVKQGNPRRSVRIIFNGSHLGRDLPFVPLEVNQPISSLVASSPVPGGDSSVAVSPPRLLQRKEKAPLRRRGSDLLKRGDRLKSSFRQRLVEIF